MISAQFRPWLAAMVLGLACWPAPAQEKPPAPAPVPSSPAPEPVGNEAVVNGQAVTKKAIFRSLKRVPEERRNEERLKVLNYLIDNVLIDQEMVRLKVAVKKKDLDDRVGEIKTEIKRNRKDFDKVMKELLLTEEELRAQLAADLRWDKFATQKATDKELRALLNESPSLFDGSTLHARHILLAATAKGAEAAAQARVTLLSIKKDIEDQVALGVAKLDPALDNLKREEARVKLLDAAFADAATKKSDCPSKTQGGDLGWFPRGRMVEAFAKVAFSLKPYQMSDVVASPVGQHLILVLESKPGKSVKFEDVKDMVNDIYRDRLREDLLAKLRQTATIVTTPLASP
jgi:parvulin-like peptidyl-prolyl isomerase